MNIRLSRAVPLQRLRRIAAVGKTDKYRGIYLAFLQHIADTPSATYRTINTEMLNVIPENQRGKAIVEMLAKDGLIHQGDTLSLTQMGQSVLAKNQMMEPHADDYLFTVIDDPLIPCHLYDYQLRKEKNSGGNTYQYLANEVHWLKRPTFPTYENETSVPSRCIPMEFNLLGRPDEVLYLYSICEGGPALVTTEESCVVELSLTDEAVISVIGKHIVQIPSDITVSDVLGSLNISSFHLKVQDGEIVSTKNFSELTPEEKFNGVTSLTLADVNAGKYGVFNVVQLDEIPIVVNDTASLNLWAEEHLLLSIRSYVDEAAYVEKCRETALWAVSRCTVPVTVEDVLAVLMPFSELLEEARHPSEAFVHVMEMNPGLRWYFLAPQYLRFVSGGDVA